MNIFSGFESAFKVSDQHASESFGDLPERLVQVFGVVPPSELLAFWNEFPPGYYGENELYFFGNASDDARSVIAWNSHGCWQKVMPPPNAGGPIFFAETCFGEQIGFRVVNQKYQAVLVIVDTMELFVLAEPFSGLFIDVLSDRFGITDPDRYSAVRKNLGVLPAGKHFAPIISPLLGGSGDADNFHIEDPLVHIVTAIGTYEAVKNLPPGTRVKGIDLNLT